MSKTNPKVLARQKRIRRIRKKIHGTATRPRLRVFKSINHTYVQIIDDTVGHTLLAMSTLDKKFQEIGGLVGKIEKARKIGEIIAEEAIAKGIDKVVFDRSGYIYHGRIKALSDGAREKGLNF